jgi:excisionase family DNA binding protein
MSDAALRELLDAAGLPAKPSYNRAEVCRLLGISRTTFWRMCNRCAGPEPELPSFRLRRHRRVPYPALARYLAQAGE